jgi:acyl-CoA-binding protein
MEKTSNELKKLIENEALKVKLLNLYKIALSKQGSDLNLQKNKNGETKIVEYQRSCEEIRS